MHLLISHKRTFQRPIALTSDQGLAYHICFIPYVALTDVTLLKLVR